MSNLVVFDLDGVLVDSKDWHYEALNNALSLVDNKYTISYSEHLSTYDGLNTTKKLKLLTERKGLDPKYYDQIWENKQIDTFRIIKSISVDKKLVNIFRTLKQENFKIAVASNSIRETVKLCLLKLGILEYVDYYVSNEDVKFTKPFPEMYWKCMSVLKCLPKNTIIVEDSHIGRQGAIDSGAHLLTVENANDLTLNKIMSKIREVRNMETDRNIPWVDSSLNVLIPMAGRGSRFEQANYVFPKPLIDVLGKPMIQMVVENLNIEANYIFLVLQEHLDKFNVEHLLKLIKPNCIIIPVNSITEGSACTTLLAKEYINNDNPLLMTNSDQYLDWNSNEVMYAFKNDSIDGGMVTFTSNHPKWSFAKLNEEGFIERVAEKDPISNISNTGVMYWSKGSDYVKYAEQMIEKNIRVNGEFYTSPVFNEAIADNKRFKIKHIDRFWGTGTPEDLNNFLREFKNV